MCDGITQGRDGMQLSLFSRDVIAMSTAIALSHDMFDAALMLGVCDKIVPGLLIGALSFGHLPTRLRARRPDDLRAAERARRHGPPAVRRPARSAATSCSRPRPASYHSAGTCTFYGTANSNQMLMEVMGLHLPGASFVNPGTPLRAALTERPPPRHRADRRGGESRRSAEIVDEKAIVNGVRGAARHRRLDQPHAAPGRDRPGRRHRR